ncbi:MAG: VOC family protein [Chloroflexota bacterium]
MTNVINWFEIPASDFGRAVKFYGEILGKELMTMEAGGGPYAMFQTDGEGVGGAIAQGEFYTPSDKGVTIYFSCGEDLSPVLGRVEAAGGQVVMPKTLIDEENGYFAFFMDTEGNRVGLHSRH